MHVRAPSAFQALCRPSWRDDVAVPGDSAFRTGGRRGVGALRSRPLPLCRCPASLPPSPPPCSVCACSCATPDAIRPPTPCNRSDPPFAAPASSMASAASSVLAAPAGAAHAAAASPSPSSGSSPSSCSCRRSGYVSRCCCVGMACDGAYGLRPVWIGGRTGTGITDGGKEPAFIYWNAGDTAFYKQVRQ